ncbi:ATP-dependent helicase, partial [Rhizobiaceae sp. 2RAB30]
IKQHGTGEKGVVIERSDGPGEAGAAPGRKPHRKGTFRAKSGMPPEDRREKRWEKKPKKRPAKP